MQNKIIIIMGTCYFSFRSVENNNNNVLISEMSYYQIIFTLKCLLKLH